MAGESISADELTAMLREVRDRVRARHPGNASGMPLADLMPLVHARDAAEAKVASIGTVNPRPDGLVNSAIQAAKRLVARALDWHVREQVEFNRGVMQSIEAIIEALNENNRILASIPVQEMQDMRSHWADWRADWERKLTGSEVRFLKTIADLQAAIQQRAGSLESSLRASESNFRAAMQAQHREFSRAVELHGFEVQKRMWEDVEKLKLEFERMIHTELRIIRQRAAVPPIAAEVKPAEAVPVTFDYGRFSERFRGTEEYVKQQQRFYVPWFRGDVLDIGCGRGEFLELMREAGVNARGIDLSAESVALCREKGLTAEVADAFAYLGALPESALDGIFCAQVVEHLAPERLPEFVRLAASRLARGGVLAIETPNPECLAIFASHFYLDPTHRRPVPHPLLAFYLEEYGMGAIEVHRRSPAVESMPALASLPEDFREAFFGGLDYAIRARKLI